MSIFSKVDFCMPIFLQYLLISWFWLFSSNSYNIIRLLQAFHYCKLLCIFEIPCDFFFFFWGGGAIALFKLTRHRTYMHIYSYLHPTGLNSWVQFILQVRKLHCFGGRQTLILHSVHSVFWIKSIHISIHISMRQNYIFTQVRDIDAERNCTLQYLT